MKRYSLYTLVVIVFGILILVSSLTIYLNISRHREDLLEVAIGEKTQLARIVNETIASPLWFYRLTLVPGMEEAFVGEMAKFKDVLYIRIVRDDGTIYQSSIKEEWNQTINDSATQEAIKTNKPVIKDEIYQGEEIKVVVYPGHSNDTIWVAFSLAEVENNLKQILIRDIILALILPIALIVFLIILAWNVTIPLKKMNRIAEEWRKGNLNARMDTRLKTEIGVLAENFNKAVSELKASRSTLQEYKEVLEIKVDARTRELKELTESLEGQVQERTKELQDKIYELEKFNKLSVGRELKMVSLKKEIQDFKNILKNAKKQNKRSNLIKNNKTT